MGVMALLAAAALQAPAVEQPPRIVVEGNGMVKTAPNIATINYSVRGEGKTNDEALKALVAAAARVDNGLRAMDSTIAPKVGDLEIAAVRGAECKIGRYSDAPALSTGVCVIAGYVATQKFTARTGLVKDVGTLVGIAGRNGATGPEISGFDITDKVSAKNRAIAAALANARTKAQAIAQGSGVILGPMISASLDSARDFDLDGTVTVETLLNELPQVIPVKVAPEDIQTTAKVTMTYAVQR